MSDSASDDKSGRGLWQRLKDRFRARSGDAALREAIEEVIEEIEGEEGGLEDQQPIGDEERLMLANVLKLRHLAAYDVMVPRADIVAVESEIDLPTLLETLTREGHSRLPVYHGELDDVQGFVHMKDVLPFVDRPQEFKLEKVIRNVLIVAPSMRALDLLLEMRRQRRHMALVIDEYGGIDGLVTIEDLVEEVVGEIEDEHDLESQAQVIERPDGSLIADGRVTIAHLEERFGPILSEEERADDIDTLGGLVTAVSGHVPARGELILHEASGMTIEVLDADPRRVRRLRLKNLPAKENDA